MTSSVQITATASTEEFSRVSELRVVRGCSILVRDENDPTRAPRQVTLPAGGRLKAKLKTSRSKRTLRDILLWLQLQHRQKQLKNELWLRLADPAHCNGGSAETISELKQQLEAAERELSSLPQVSWNDCRFGVELPALCGSTPYFPAAP